MTYFSQGMGRKAGKNLRKSDIKRAVPAKIKHFTVFIWLLFSVSKALLSDDLSHAFPFQTSSEKLDHFILFNSSQVMQTYD